MADTAPVQQWEAPLPATPDYRMHKTFVIPPLKNTGTYLIVASGRAGFPEADNRLFGMYITVGDLVLVTRHEGTDAEVTVLSGASGKAGGRRGSDAVQVRLEQAAPARGIKAQRRARHRSIPHRSAKLPIFPGCPEGRPDRLRSSASLCQPAAISRQTVPRPCFSQIAASTGLCRNCSGKRCSTKAARIEPVSRHRRQALLPFPSRTSMTRKSNPRRSQPTVSAPPPANLSFRPAEHWADGIWKAPWAAQQLSRWRNTSGRRSKPKCWIRRSRSGSISRPVLKGEAKYYFGLPVTSGQVKWLVRREPVFPWWWGYCWWGGLRFRFTPLPGGRQRDCRVERGWNIFFHILCRKSMSGWARIKIFPIGTPYPRM